MVEIHCPPTHLLTVPFHLPTHTQATRSGSPHPSQPPQMGRAHHFPADAITLPRACGHLRTRLINQAHPTTDGHYILTLSDLQLPLHPRILLDANMNSTFYPTRNSSSPPFTKHSTEGYAHMAFLAMATSYNTQHLHHQPRFTPRLVRQLQDHLGENVVLRHADHELQQLHIFCPSTPL